MREWLPGGVPRWSAAHWPAVATVLAWGAAEMALRLRLVIRPGFRARVRSVSAVVGGRLREWTFLVVVGSIAAAVIGAVWLSGVASAAIGGGLAVIILGELVAVAGMALRIWAILTLDQLFTFVIGIADGHRVVQHGPYRFLRHPGYAGVLLTLLGIGIALENWLSLLLIVVVPVLALGVRITVEEATLAAALGSEYRAYADRTARLIPHVW